MKNFICALFLTTISCSNSFALHPDQELVNKIESSLNSIKIGSHEFEIASRFGDVTLKGYVSSAEDKQRVENYIRNIDGVDSLTSELEIEDAKASASIQSKTVQCPEFKAPPIEKGKVTFSCRGNDITVNGTIGSIADRNKLKNAISNSVPEANVIMNAEIESRPSDEVLQRTLEDALAKEGRLNEESITFFVRDGVAYFRGSVSHHTEIDAMLATANMIDGLKDVRSDVRVGE